MRTLRAAATAILLGTTALGAVAVTLALPAQAAVSKAFGTAINDAKSLAASGNYKGASARVNEAAGLAKSPEETKIVGVMRDYIASKSGDISTPIGAKAKFANDANAQRWKDVIADGDALAKMNSLDGQSQLVIAQAYYQMHDSKGCMNYIKRHGLGGETALLTLQRCAFDAGDDDTQRGALEQLVASTGKPEHWKSLLHLAERSRGLKDHNTLDIFRIKEMTGTMDPADIVLYATFAIQFKSAAEAKAVVEKAMADKTIPSDDRNNRLLKTANDRLNEYNAALPKTLADAQKSPKGDDLVHIGEFQIGAGKATDAIATINAGIAKGLNDPSEGELRLGTAYLAAGQKADAIKTFNAVKGDDKVMMVAHLYALAARSEAAAPKADAAPAKKKRK